jgi:hypothetical protein
MKYHLAILAEFLVATGIALAATFTYRCPQCGLFQQYNWPGIYKCPSDGTTMIQQIRR